MRKLQSDYLELFVKLTFSRPDEVEPMPVSGSTRQYFRFKAKSLSMIGVYNPNVEENVAFLSFAQKLYDSGFNVPEIKAVSADQKFYLQSDLGDQTLFDLLVGNASKPYGDDLMELLKDSIRHLVEFQFKAVEKLDFSLSWPTGVFNKKTILDDFYYFKYYFLKVIPEFVFNEYRLDIEFEKLAERINEAPAHFFMYRDFQSRNIMVYDSKLYFVDFQGARMGPLQYDLISLLYQVRASIPDTIKDQLIETYIETLKKYADPEKLRFREFLPYFILFRLFQVMGAYGFRGLIQKRPHFLQSIPFALDALRNQLKTHVIKTEFPYLFEVLTNLLETQKNEDFIYLSSNKLHIELSSFSYKKKGIPIDFSGNGGGHVFDCRPLPNPGREQYYKQLTGRDLEVAAFLERHPEVAVYMDSVKKILTLSIENYLERNFNHLMISFGCTGGQHRSVYFTEKIHQWIQEVYPEVFITKKHHEL